MAEILQESGITATFYHAGLSNFDKDYRQKAWQEDKIRVMVATNAFGMGIDKADVRAVIHLQIPDSPEAYFQEAGRGGRDGKQSYAVLLYQKADRTKLLRRISEVYPEKDFIRQVYEHLAYYFQMAVGDGLMVTREFDMEEFCTRFKHFPVHTFSALKILEQSGYIEHTDEQESHSRIMFTVRRDELYNFTFTEQQEQIIRILLRLYSGLFADYVYIEEGSIARLCSLTAQDVYERLKGLSRIGVVHYVPRKRTAYITYTRRRVDMEEVAIPFGIYEKRKEQLERRIQAMLDYAERDDRCRSEMLLHYFGEEGTQPCGLCDRCRSKKGKRKKTNDMMPAITQLLADGKEHLLTELKALTRDPEALQQALHELQQEEVIEQSGIVIRLKTKTL
ncbi:MAG: RecQ family zinc-binding domain-containing protein [Bacteroidaceae bacterium]|nr:RecQ family zinc-binding domain-containing protein [Bacteroidaceae bacterium]